MTDKLSAILASLFLAASLCAMPTLVAAEGAPPAEVQAGAYSARKGVLVLGYNMREPNWEAVMWGTPPDKPGRLVRAAAVVMSENPAVAVISGGPGRAGEKSEAWWSRKRLYDGLGELGKFTIYPVLGRYSAEDIRERLDRTLMLEEKAGDTVENIKFSAPLLEEAGAEEVILITSPDHVSRSIKEALRLWGGSYPRLAANLYGTASATLYSARTPQDAAVADMQHVLVYEPPVMKKFDISRVFSVLNDTGAVSEIDAVLRRRGK